MAQVNWRPDRTTSKTPWPMPRVGTALGRGLLCRCPACGEGRVFDGYLRVTKACTQCGAPLGLARADDAPPYFTIFLVGHIVVLMMLWTQQIADPSPMTLTAIFVPLTIVLVLALLRPIKGATVGAMLALNMLKPEDEQDSDAAAEPPGPALAVPAVAPAAAVSGIERR